MIYRGKDFLPPAVSAAIEERRNYGIHMGKMRMDGNSSVEAAVNFKLVPAEQSYVDEVQEVNDQKRACASEQRKLSSKGAAIKSLDAKLSLVCVFKMVYFFMEAEMLYIKP